VTAVARVSDLAEQIRGVSYGKEDASSAPRPGYLPVLRAGNISDDGLVFDDLVFVPAARIAEKQKIRRNDVVIAASSGSLDIVGKAARAIEDYEGGFGAFCKVLRPGPDVDPAYFAHFFRTPEYRRRISALAAGANINNLRNEHLDELPVPLPPLSEQRRIANILDTADALRIKRRATLTKLDTLTQSIFLDTFGDPATNPKRWEVSTIECISEKVTDGEHLTPKRQASGIKLLSARNVRDGQIDLSQVDYVGLDEYARIAKRCDPKRGDVLISCSGTIGRVASVESDEPLALVRSAAMVRPDQSRVTTTFLELYLRTPALRGQMLRRANASSQANLFQNQIRSVPVFVPPLPIQQAFGDKAAAVGLLRRKANSSDYELTRLFKSIQHRAFRGEV
jgi:type I restriction enzyme, S subunit